MIVQTRPQWLHVVEKLKASRDAGGVRVLALDTETVDCGYPDIHITSFSVAWYEGVDANGVAAIDGAYIPVGHNTGELQLARVDVYPELKALLEDPSIEKVFQNAKYDINVLTLFTAEPHDPVPFSVARLLQRGKPAGAGIYVDQNSFDTFIAHFLLNTNGVGTPAQVLAGEGGHGLKDLSYYLLGHKMTELADLAQEEKYEHRGGKHTTLRTDLVPIHDVVVEGKVTQQGLGGYAWDDAVQTLKLRDLFKRQLAADPKTERVYRTIHREFTFVLAEMERFGMELDAPMLLEMAGRVRVELDQIAETMYAARPGENFDRLVDADLVKHCCEQYADLDRRFALPKDNPEYPQKAVTKGEGRGTARRTWTEMQPAAKGTLRKELFVAHGLAGHPVEEMIRDDKLRPELTRFPHLAHKIFKIGSNQQLNTVLFEECNLPPLGEKSEDGLWSTKAEYIDIWADGGRGHPMAVSLSRYREIDKLHGTYLVTMPTLLASDDRLRTRLNQTGARSGRLSSADPNCQNIPTNGDEFPIRRAFVATGVLACNVTVHEWVLDDKGKPLRPKRLEVHAMPGNARGFDGGYELNDGWVTRWWGTNPPWVLFVGDYSQLEIALLAHVSGDQTLIDAIINKVDIHAMTAQACFDAVPKDISLEEVKKSYKKYRTDAKPISFGCVPMDTLALTKRGWKSFAEVEVGDETLGLSDGLLKWTPVLEKVRYTDAPVVEMSTKQKFRARCTPNHRWYGTRRFGYMHRKTEAGVWSADALTREHCLTLAAPAVTARMVDVTPAEAAVVAWLKTDGSLVWSAEGLGTSQAGGRRRGVSAQLHQSKPEGVAAIRELLIGAAIPHTETATKRMLAGQRWPMRMFVLRAQWVRDLWSRARLHERSLESFVLDLDPAQRAAFLDAAMLAEGCWWPPGTLRANGKQSAPQFAQNAGPVCEAVRLAAFLEGFFPTTYDQVSYNGRAHQKLRLKKAHITCQRLQQRTIGRADVWCVRTELGSWVMKQGDQIMVTGNTIYGMGPASLGRSIGVDVETAKVIINDRYMARYPGVKTYIEQSHAFAKMHGYVETAIGRKRHLPAAQLETMPWKQLPRDDPYMLARDRRNGLISQAKRQAQNTKIQGFAADLVALAMRELWRYFRRTTWEMAAAQGDVMLGEHGEVPATGGPLWDTFARLLLQVHDEVLQEFHPAIANFARRESVRLMEAAGGVKLKVPLTVDAALGTNWLDTKA